MLKLDMHIHSNHSLDSTARVADIIKRAKAQGLDGIAITDHNSIEGSLEAYSLAVAGKAEGLIVVRGMEVSTAEKKHILAYGISKEIPKGLPAKDVIKRIEIQKGVAVAPHPYRFPSGLGQEVVESGSFHAIEIINGRSPAGQNARAKALALRLKIGTTGGSDAHDLESVGKAYTCVKLETADEKDILEKIRKRNLPLL